MDGQKNSSSELPATDAAVETDPHLKAASTGSNGATGAHGATGNGSTGNGSVGAGAVGVAAEVAARQLTGQAFSRGSLDRAVEAASDGLVELQHAEGYWVGELEADVSLNAEYIMFLHFMGYDEPDTVHKLVDYIRERQSDDGSWGIFEGADGNLSITVEAYFAAKLAGYRPERDPWLQKAGDWIRAQGGLESCRMFTKIYLSYFGQTVRDEIPTMPVSFILLPNGQPFNIYEVACWARSYTVPLLVLNHLSPVVDVPEGADVTELRLKPVPEMREPQGYRETARAIQNTTTKALQSFWTDWRRAKNKLDVAAKLFRWENVFQQSDRVFKLMEKRNLSIPAISKLALKKAEQWIVEHQDEPGDWGGIFPSMVNSIMALAQLGYGPSHERLVRGKEALERLHVHDRSHVTGEPGGQIRQQPCASPVWDTAWAILAIQAALGTDGRPICADERTRDSRPRSAPVSAFDGTAARQLDTAPQPRAEAEPAIAAAARAAQRWMEPRQIRTRGDWSVKNPTVEPGGWCFQFANASYPDIDDTAVVLMALIELQKWVDPDWRATIARGINWVVAMQNDDGGWGAFERAVPGNILENVPYNDCDNLGDPSTPDLTGRLLECLGRIGRTASNDRAVSRGVEYLKRVQECDGSWFGRWGVNHIYGTWSVVAGLHAIGANMNEDYAARALNWIERTQNADGGWGEACDTYVDPEYRGLGRSTASQTAWAVLALVHGGRAKTDATRLGVSYLIRNQGEDGLWRERWYTGTGFPGHFYLKYHYYAKYFPLLALARYRRASLGLPIRNPIDPTQLLST